MQVEAAMNKKIPVELYLSQHDWRAWFPPNENKQSAKATKPGSIVISNPIFQRLAKMLSIKTHAPNP